MELMKNGAFCSDLSQSPNRSGTTSGATKYHRNNCTSRGMLRNSSTHTVPAACVMRPGSTRRRPTTVPATMATVQAIADTSIVVTRPPSKTERYVPVPSGDCAQKIPQFQ